VSASSAPARAHPRQAGLERWLPFVIAAALMLYGYLRLLPAATSAGETIYPTVASGNVAWSDIISIYGRSDLAGHPLPYVHGHSLEYPVLTGIVFYLAGFVGYTSSNVVAAFSVNYALLALSGLGLLWLLRREPGANPWLFACAPALVLYTGANWDLLALFSGIGSLLLYRRNHDLAATVLLALSVWLKFFAILWLPLVLIERARRRLWGACARILALFALLSVVVNLPFALRDAYEWGLFSSFNRERAPEVNFWTIIRDAHLSVDTINTLSLLAVVLAVAILGAVQWRHGTDLTVPAAAILITWFFVVNKIYSPQYFIWLVPFLALLAVPLPLYIALVFVDAIYYVCSFQILHIGYLLGTAESHYRVGAWDFDHVLMPAMELRELVFLGLIAWVAWACLRPQP
jgi:hypothetical protein